MAEKNPSKGKPGKAEHTKGRDPRYTGSRIRYEDRDSSPGQQRHTNGSWERTNKEYHGVRDEDA